MNLIDIRNGFPYIEFLTNGNFNKTFFSCSYRLEKTLMDSNMYYLVMGYGQGPIQEQANKLGNENKWCGNGR